MNKIYSEILYFKIKNTDINYYKQMLIYVKYLIIKQNFYNKNKILIKYKF